MPLRYRALRAVLSLSRGKDFLSATVTEALGTKDVTVKDLPAPSGGTTWRGA
jgi:hypothetical protein